MHAFYTKYADDLGVKTALKLIKKEISSALNHANDESIMATHLDRAHTMIEDFFANKKHLAEKMR